MFDVAPSELLLVIIVAVAVIGPKDLPKVARTVGNWVAKARGMARHFRSGVDAMMREAELEELEKQWRAHNEAIMRAYPRLGPLGAPGQVIDGVATPVGPGGALPDYGAKAAPAPPPPAPPAPPPPETPASAPPAPATPNP